VLVSSEREIVLGREDSSVRGKCLNGRGASASAVLECASLTSLEWLVSSHAFGHTDLESRSALLSFAAAVRGIDVILVGRAVVLMVDRDIIQAGIFCYRPSGQPSWHTRT
jgi:hypothetical protein